VGDGVAFLRPSNWDVVRADVRFDEHGPNKLYYQDRAHQEGMVLIWLLPKGVVAPSVESIHPKPILAKSHKGRMAIFWELRGEETEVVCDVTSMAEDQAERAVEALNASLRTMDPAPASSIMETPPPEEPLSPTGWLLLAASRIPALVYAIAVVGIVAAAALSVGFFIGQWPYAIFGGVAVTVGMFLLRLYATSQLEALAIDVSGPVRVLIWTCVIAFVAVVVMGLVSFAIFLFGPKATGATPSGRGTSFPSKPTTLSKGEELTWRVFERWADHHPEIVMQHGFSEAPKFANVHDQYFENGQIIYNVTHRWAVLLYSRQGQFRRVPTPDQHLTPGDARTINEALFTHLTRGWSEQEISRYRSLIESRTKSPNLTGVGIIGGIATLYVSNNLYDSFGMPQENEYLARDVLVARGLDCWLLVGSRHGLGGINEKSPRRVFIFFENGRYEMDTEFPE
jgi:hypothetical protein